MSVYDNGDDLEEPPAVTAQAGLAAAQSAVTPQPGTDDDNEDEG